MGGNNKSYIKWSQLKFIWNFPTQDIYSLIEKNKEGKINWMTTLLLSFKLASGTLSNLTC